jgi:hypothetical protein
VLRCCRVKEEWWVGGYETIKGNEVSRRHGFTGVKGIAEKNNNIPGSAMGYNKLTKYEKSVRWRGHGHGQVNWENALDQW